MEFIYVVKRYDLFDLAFPHGLVLRGQAGTVGQNEKVHDVGRYVERILEKGFFIERSWAEQDSSFKQVIPYTVVACGSDVLLLQRLGGGGEPRLSGKLSIGVGGHINPVDAAPRPRLLEAGALRELNEELILGSRPEMKVVGLVNDESNPVGSVHFGVVHLLRLQEPHVEVKEKDQLIGSFVPVSVIRERVAAGENFETWSSLVASRLDEILAI